MIDLIIKIGDEEYSLYEDFKLYITNSNPIGDPVISANFLSIPGRNWQIDLTDAVIGEPTYTHRPITVNVSGRDNVKNWDASMSRIRNLLDGQIARFTFTNDPEWFWRGRCSVSEFSAAKTLGNFTISMDYAEPYKHQIDADYSRRDERSDIFADGISMAKEDYFVHEGATFVMDCPAVGLWDVYIETSSASDQMNFKHVNSGFKTVIPSGSHEIYLDCVEVRGGNTIELWTNSPGQTAYGTITFARKSL